MKWLFILLGFLNIGLQANSEPQTSSSSVYVGVEPQTGTPCCAIVERTEPNKGKIQLFFEYKPPEDFLWETPLNEDLRLGLGTRYMKSDILPGETAPSVQPQITILWGSSEPLPVPATIVDKCLDLKPVDSPQAQK